MFSNHTITSLFSTPILSSQHTSQQRLDSHLSFEHAGVHAVMLYREDGLIHTPGDAIDRIVPASLAETVSVALATLQAMAPGP